MGGYVPRTRGRCKFKMPMVSPGPQKEQTAMGTHLVLCHGFSNVSGKHLLSHPSNPTETAPDA